MTIPWQLVTVELDGARVAAIADGARILHPPLLHPYRGAIEALHAWDVVGPALRSWTPDDADVVPAARVHRVVPLAFPAKVLCSGPNFTDHLAEMGESGLGDGWTAYFFLKPPTTALVADGAAVYVDDPERDRLDWEGELGVVLGTGGRDIPAASALEHVAGYVVANDLSLRGPHRRSTPAAPFQWDWLASKGADASLPISGMVPAWAVADPQALRIRTSVNGVRVQDGTTADMVLDVAALIADASRLVTLEPGDLILTGTPAGVGAGRGVFLQPGDVVEVDIPGVGSIANTVHRRTPNP